MMELSHPRNVLLAAGIAVGAIATPVLFETTQADAQAQACTYVVQPNTGADRLKLETGLTAAQESAYSGIPVKNLFTHASLPYPCKPGESPAQVDTPISVTSTNATPATSSAGSKKYSISDIQNKTNELLVPFGMPTLPLNGNYGEMTKRAVCTAEWLLNYANVSRSVIKPNSEAANLIMSSDAISVPLKSRNKSGKWADVNKICQTAVFGTNSQVDMIFPISTGKVPELDTPVGTYKTVKYDPALLTQSEQKDKNNKRRSGWHDSIDSPSPSKRGNMYRPYYLNASNGGVAFHGADQVPTFPASHRCIRTRPADQDKLILWAGLGNQITMTNKVLALSVVIEGTYEG